MKKINKLKRNIEIKARKEAWNENLIWMEIFYQLLLFFPL